MKAPCHSIQCLITTITVSMGLFSLLLALFTGNLYSRLTMEGKTEEIGKQVATRVKESTQQLKQHMLQYSVTLANSSPFKTTLAYNNQEKLSHLLTKQFQSPFLSSGTLDVIQINLYNASFSPVTQVNKTNSTNLNKLHCNNKPFITQVNILVNESSVYYSLCPYDKFLAVSAVIPIRDNLSRYYYLEVVSDMSYHLELLSEVLGMPLRVRSSADNVVFQSHNWSAFNNEPERNTIASYEMPLINSRPSFLIDVFHDNEYVENALSHARSVVIIVTISVTLIIIMIMHGIARIALLRPVKEMIDHIRQVRENKAYLGHPLAIEGTAEIQELAQDFNSMSNELKHLYQSLETMALTDTLTNLGNRKWFHDHLTNMVDSSERRSIPFALMVMDLDKFKQINDVLGHKAGDILLQKVSKKFMHVLRDSDTLIPLANSYSESIKKEPISRLGGDEFAVVLPMIDNKENALIVAKKLCEAVKTPFDIAGHSVIIGVSIGVALYPKHSRDKDQLLHQADIAMYYAKKKGVGYAVYNEEMSDGLNDGNKQSFDSRAVATYKNNS